MASAIRPNREQFVELASSSDTGPVVMLNLLKFKARAEGESGSGADAYKRYGEAAVKMVEEQGGRVLWQGRADQILIGDPEQGWDSVVLVEYPSRKAFIDMVSTPKYEAAHEHREAGLERTVLVAMTEQYRGAGATDVNAGHEGEPHAHATSDRGAGATDVSAGHEGEPHAHATSDGGAGATDVTDAHDGEAHAHATMETGS